MTLESYMKLVGMTDAKLAIAIKRDRSVVTRLRNGSIKPSFEVMVALEKVTEGLVKPSDFVEAA